MLSILTFHQVNTNKKCKQQHSIHLFTLDMVDYMNYLNLDNRDVFQWTESMFWY